MTSSGAEDPQRAWEAGLGTTGALAAAGLGTWCWNAATDAFGGDPCCLQLLDALGNPPRTLESLIRLVHPQDRTMFRATLREAAQTRCATTIEFRAVSTDFAVRWLQCLMAARTGRTSDTETLLIGVLGPAGVSSQGTAPDAPPDLHHLLQAAPVATAKFDRELRLVSANDRFLETLRLGRFEWQGQTLYDALPEMPDSWREAVDRCLNGLDVQTAAQRFERADGSHDLIDGQIYPWYDGNNEIGGVLLITEVRAPSTDVRFALVVDQTPVAIAMSEPDGILRYANPAWIGLTGRSRDEIVGADALQHLHPDDRASGARNFRRMAAGGPQNRQVRLLLPSGEVRAIELHSRPMLDDAGQSRGIIHAALDITGHARQHQEAGQMLVQLRELVLYLEKAREFERSQTARSLQHGLYELLFELHADLTRWARGVDGVAPPVAAVGQLAMRSQSAVEQLRYMLFELTPPGVAELGLGGALSRFCSEYGERAGLPVELVMPARPIAAEDPVLDALYCIAREAVVDAAGHDGVTRIKVQVELLAGAIRLRVEDNGTVQRIDEQQFRGRGSGLLAASLRLRDMGGTMRVLGVTGATTTLEVSVPMQRHES
jgi:PAS domain S-box-containing protein